MSSTTCKSFRYQYCVHYRVSELGQCSSLGWIMLLPTCLSTQYKLHYCHYAVFRYQLCVHYRVLVHNGNVVTVKGGITMMHEQKPFGTFMCNSMNLWRQKYHLRLCHAYCLPPRSVSTLPTGHSTLQTMLRGLVSLSWGDIVPLSGGHHFCLRDISVVHGDN